MDRRWEQKRTEGYIIVFIYYTLPFSRCGIGYNYIIIETKEFARIGYNGFLFPHSYSGDGLGATHAEKEIRYI
jgi:hypothetical protein